MRPSSSPRRSSKSLWLFFLICGCECDWFGRQGQSSSFLDNYDYDDYGYEEILLLGQFKESVLHLVTKDFMKSDAYLLRWLKAYDLALEETVEKFKKSLEWRQHNHIDTILQEDFTKMDKMLPIELEGLDKDGRPVFWVPMGTYDVRRITLSGGEPTFQRYMIHLYELCEAFMYEIGSTSTSSGHGHDNITQAVVIFDMSGFSRERVGCLKCLTLLPEFASNFETHYPMFFYKAYYINSPSAFETIFHVAKRLMVEKTRKAVRVFGYDKHKWSDALLQQIPADQLRTTYGGTKPATVINRGALDAFLGAIRNRNRVGNDTDTTTTTSDYDDIVIESILDMELNTTVELTVPVTTTNATVRVRGSLSGPRNTKYGRRRIFRKLDIQSSSCTTCSDLIFVGASTILLLFSNDFVTVDMLSLLLSDLI